MRKIPWWGAYPLSAGVAGMSAFAGTLAPWIQAVGFSAGAVLFFIGIAATVGHFGWNLAFSPKLSERHEAILLALPPPLARVQELSMVYGPRDRDGIREATLEAERLVAEIPYDDATSQTVRDFLHFCELVVHDSEMRWDDRENRDIVHRMSIGLFRYLHEGKPVDRRKIDVPDWLREATDKGKKRPPPSAPPPQPEPLPITENKAASAISFDQAFKERSEDRIPFVRIRDLAPAYGLGLAQHDADASDVAYRVEGALRQAAVDGDVKVWGRRYRDVPNMEPIVPIPSLHFEDYSFAHGILNCPTDNKEARTNTIQMATWGQKGKTGATYYDLYLSLGDTENVLSKVSRRVAS
jgi:hypothetical protein